MEEEEWLKVLLIVASLQTKKSVASCRHNMFFLTFILVTVLLPKASSLTCCTGQGSSCTSTQCSAYELCGATRITAYLGGTQITDLTRRSCALAENCASGSINNGVTKTVANTVCCSTDNCNNQNVPEPPSSTPNGKKCFTCDGRSCTTIMNCEGTEDHCISTTALVDKQKVPLKGCASKLFCSDIVNSQLAAVIGDKINCCQGNLCNGASRTSAAILMLVTPLLSLIMFA
ncbi:phospholipase A2 inhibitor and Ly6/PLAUR domain-containing protein-like [Thalassophryne amazonica]|uniref:phospholipase A2 inhibitor and Ly6/PLAUR domain-containing protein-like n=1 Tax=Thalassophryne amazonica TaxID=390379 RepID=UPI0014724A0F|nr:phospholipase A2 inhibitor and Ly6/PLAUR domain-containing protein-like [Thalassophryne amazonica]